MWLKIKRTYFTHKTQYKIMNFFLKLFLIFLPIFGYSQSNKFISFAGGIGPRLPTANFTFRAEFENKFEYFTPIFECNSNVDVVLKNNVEADRWRIFNTLVGIEYTRDKLFIRGLIGTASDFEFGFDANLCKMSIGYQNYRNFRVYDGDYKAAIYSTFSEKFVVKAMYVVSLSDINRNGGSLGFYMLLN